MSRIRLTRMPVDGAHLDLRASAPVDASNALSPRAIKESAEALREGYLRYIADRAEEHRTDPRWWTGTVAERNPFVSQAFFGIARIAAVARWIESRRGESTIVVDEPPLAEGLAATLAARGYEVRNDVRRSAIQPLRDAAEFIARRIYFAIKMRRRMSVARRAIALMSRPVSHEPLTVVQEWIDVRNFDAASARLKPFVNFAAARAELEASGTPIATLPFVLRTVPFKAAVEALVRQRTAALLPDAFIRPTDVLSVIFRSVRRPRRRYPNLEDIVCAPFFDEDDRRDWIHHRWCETELMDAMVRGWKRAGLSIARVIYTFENHTWERVLCRALSREYPGAVRVGFQGPALSRFRLNEYMTAREWESCPVPDKVVTFGTLAFEQLAAEGAPASRLAIGAAPWLARLLAAAPPGAAGRTVLVLLSIAEHESREIVERVVTALAGRDVRVAIKAHPTMPPSRVWGARPLPLNVAFDPTPIPEQLPRAAAVLYGSTGASLEAFGAGVRPIHVALTRVLDQDPLEYWPDQRDVAYSTEDMRRLVEQALGETEERRHARQRAGRDALASYFGTDERAWLRALTA